MRGSMYVSFASHFVTAERVARRNTYNPSVNAIASGNSAQVLDLSRELGGLGSEGPACNRGKVTCLRLVHTRCRS